MTGEHTLSMGGTVGCSYAGRNILFCSPVSVGGGGIWVKPHHHSTTTAVYIISVLHHLTPVAYAISYLYSVQQCSGSDLLCDMYANYIIHSCIHFLDVSIHGFWVGTLHTLQCEGVPLW